MFGLNCRRAKLRRFVTSEKYYPARFFCIPFEHNLAVTNQQSYDYHAGLRTGSPGSVRIITHQWEPQKGRTVVCDYSKSEKSQSGAISGTPAEQNLGLAQLSFAQNESSVTNRCQGKIVRGDYYQCLLIAGIGNERTSDFVAS